MPASADDAPPDLSGLLELARIEHLDLKPVILRVQTDLFVRAGARDRADAGIFESLACGLIPTVDEDTARIVADKLAPFPGTPPAVLDALAARGGAAAAAVITQAPALTPGLVAAALAGAAEGAALLAARPDLDRAASEEISRDGRPEVDAALADNRGAPLRGAALARLARRGRDSGDLARRLLVRPDVSAADLAPLYLHADPIRREAIGRAVEATAALRPGAAPPRGLGEALTALSAARDVPAFVAALGEGLGLPPDFLGAAPDAGTRYDLLTLGLRAAGLHEEEAVYVFLTLNQGVARSAERVAGLVRLFRTVTRAAARDLIAAILDLPPERARGEAHRPPHAPEARRPEGAARQGAARPAQPRPALPTPARRATGEAG